MPTRTLIWESDKRFTLTITPAGPDPEPGFKKYRYRLEEDGDVLFHGDDFAGPEDESLDSDELVFQLLLSLAPGEEWVYEEDEYTPRQIDFCENDADDLFDGDPVEDFIN